ncbi:MAG: leucine-rich repeat protein, partial [Oscillospiraceae bacterium]|nr:leucine-rich repeat protein [Oscillospiraceae bacterium]
MLKRLTAAVLSLTIMFSAVAPAAYALDETEPVQEIQAEEQADVPDVSEETPAAEETEKTVETEETQTENTMPDVQPSAEDSQAVTETTASVTEDVAVDSDLPDNDEIFGAYVEQQFYGNAMAVFGTEARERLTATEKAIYDVLKAHIVKVAAEGGETDGIEILVEDCFADNPIITAQQLGLEKFEVIGGAVNPVHANLVWEAFKNHYANDFNTHNILIALLHDCPYELYWFDKTKEAGMSISSVMSFEGTNEGLFNAQVAKMYFAFKVEADYQAGNNVTVKGDVASVKTAVENANNIAAEYADKSDFEKMLGFKNEICNLVEYNHEAAENENMSYGNPWQMIYVFDNDPATNVVCEGYAKAFQYLCDMTEVECYTTKGMMYGGTGAGAHMWNIVPIGNSSFIVDITNSDAGTIGYGGQLFLGGTANGSVESGYVFTIGNTDVKYIYDADEIAMWGNELLTLAAANFNPVPKEIEKGTYGENITWTVSDTDYDGKGDRIVIEGSGELADIDEAAPWEAYKTDITEAVIGDGITYIGFNMFGGYASLKVVELPQTVTEIGAYAFNGTAIEEIIIPNGVTEIKANTFSGCDKLHNVVLPQTVTAIGTQAFADCTSLEEIKIPQNVQTIDAEAFWGCTALKSLVYGGSAQNWFDNFSDVVLSDKVNVTVEGEKIIYVLNEEGTGYVLAYWDDAAGKVVVAESFRNLPVTEIAEAVFAFNNDITEVVVPENVTSIGVNAFNSCKNIKTITLPSTLMSIGSNALAGCSALETVIFSGDAQDWYDRELYAYVPSKANTEFKGNGTVFLELIDHNEGTGRYTLYHWYNASGAIEIPSSFRGNPVVAIAANALAGNTDITSVTIADGVEYISESAFAGCTNLEEISLPESLWRIYNNVFADCGSLEKVYYPSEYNWHNGAVEFYSGNESLTNAEFEFATDWGYIDVNGQYYVTGKYNISEHIIIPAEILGHKIYGIIGVDENYNIAPAFHNCTEIKRITVSDGVEVITCNSFEGCTSIEEIFIPLSFKGIRTLTGISREDYFKGVPRTAKIYVAQGNNTAVKNTFKNLQFVNVLDYIPLNDISTKETITVAINTPTALPSVTKVPANAYGTINPVWTAAEGFEEFVEITKDQAGKQLVKVKTLDAVQLTVTDANSGKSATVDVLVKLPKGEKLTVSFNEPIEAQGLQTGESRTITIVGSTLGEIDAKYFDFKSSNEKAVTVDENGVVTSCYTGTKSATATVTATLKNDSSKKATVSVKAIAKQVQELPLEKPV